MIEVRPKDNSLKEFDKAVKLFKKKCDKEGFLKEIQERKFYKKPSDKKREYIRALEAKHSRKKEK